uniref:RHS repeat domain-containing protein n=1 Tax=uncultured Maribacter sp. TaxID=431308 RepID=UPI00261CE0E9
PVNTDKLVSWVFDYNSFVPAAKIVDGNTYSIACDHLGTPVQAYNQTGEKVWDCTLDIYGKIKTLEGDKCFIPFRYQGQYEDEETGLYYNRFRYYSPDTGTYISQDPIGLSGGNKLYSYTNDVNQFIDPLGLSKYNPTEVLGRKIYQNNTDFVTGKPDFVDKSVHPSIKAKN